MITQLCVTTAKSLRDFSRPLQVMKMAYVGVVYMPAGRATGGAGFTHEKIVFSS